MTSSADRSPDKSAKKTGRKQTKALQLVARDYQIVESVGGEPSINILVCNAGLVTGCSQVKRQYCGTPGPQEPQLFAIAEPES
jgi:hypothetical protein